MYYVSHWGRGNGKTTLNFTIDFSIKINSLLKALFSHLLSHKSKGGHPGRHFKVTPLCPYLPQGDCALFHQHSIDLTTTTNKTAQLLS